MLLKDVIENLIYLVTLIFILVGITDAALSALFNSNIDYQHISSNGAAVVTIGSGSLSIKFSINKLENRGSKGILSQFIDKLAAPIARLIQ